MRPWVITGSYVGGSIVAGFLLPYLEYTYVGRSAAGISISSAQAFLASVSSGMMALTGIMFSLAFVMVQMSGTAYSPRLASWFTRDPVLFNALGIFVATFVYSLATLAWVDREKTGYAPFYSLLIVLALVVASIILLTLLIQRVGTLQITNVLRLVGNAGRRAIEKTLPLPDAVSTGGGNAWAAFELNDSKVLSQRVVYSGIPKVVAFADIDSIARVAGEADAVVALMFATGDTLTDGMVLFEIYGAKRTVSERTLIETLDINWERSVEHDPKYAFRLLVDVAIKALSPAINDPTTAVQSLDQIEDLLLRLIRRKLEPGTRKDESGALRVVYPCASWEDYLALAFDEIRLCGSSQLQVLRRLHSALHNLQNYGGPRADAVRTYRLHLDASIETSALDNADRAFALEEDRQGLGVTR